MGVTLTDKGWSYTDDASVDHKALVAPLPGEHDSAEDVYDNLKLLDEALWTFSQAGNLLGTAGATPDSTDIEGVDKDPDDENTDNYYQNGTQYLTTQHTHPVPDLVPHSKLATLARLADVATLAKASEKLVKGFEWTINNGLHDRTTDAYTADGEAVQDVDLVHTHILSDIVDDIVADYMRNGFSYSINNGLTDRTTDTHKGDKAQVDNVDLVHLHKKADIVDGGEYMRRIFYGTDSPATYMGDENITPVEGDVYIKYYE